MKGGTTSLWSYLREHPQVFLTSPKEPHFFTQGGRGTWDRGIPWYEGLFDGAHAATARGEASASYTLWPEYDGVPDRIAHTVPTMKLIYLVRNPIERLRSHYIHNVRRGNERRPFADVLIEDSPYLAGSSYTTQLERYLEYFQPHQILVITSENLRFDRIASLQRVFSFLGVDCEFTPSNIDVEFNDSTKKGGSVRPSWVRIAKVPGVRRLAQLTPGGIRERSDILTRGTLDTASIVVGDELTARLVDRLRPEVEGLRPFLTTEFDGWGIW